MAPRSSRLRPRRLAATAAAAILLACPVARAQHAAAPLTPFARAKAEALLRNRLPCLGCHALAGDGGRIGPDLGVPSAARTPARIRAMIDDPQRAAPGSLMPRIPMPAGWRDLLVAYLAERAGTAGPAARAAAADASDRKAAEPAAPPAAPAADTRAVAPGAAPPAPAVGGADADAPGAAASGGAALYGKYCAPCHGAGGRGDGPNARFLPVRPTAHADSAYMSTRPDDTLFDGIFAGGAILGRSQRMPPFGWTLTREEIRALVRYLRTLCRCEGPAWSRDQAAGRRR